MEQRKNTVPYMHRNQVMLKVPTVKNRRAYQALTALLVNFHLWNIFTGKLYEGKLKSLPFPVMNCYACPASVYSCPIGTLSHFLVLSKVPFVVLGLLTVVSTAFGRWICGWMCPFGLLQDLLYRLPSWKFDLPPKLQSARFIMLVVAVVALPLLYHKHFFCMVCPVGTVEAGIYWTLVSVAILNMAGAFFLFKLSVATLVAYMSVFVKRPFCRYLCPLGAFFSIFNRFSMVDFEVDKDACIECNLCRKACPVNHPVYLSPNATACIRCLNCVRVCPAVKLRYHIFDANREVAL